MKLSTNKQQLLTLLQDSYYCST